MRNIYIFDTLRISGIPITMENSLFADGESLVKDLLQLYRSDTRIRFPGSVYRNLFTTDPDNHSFALSFEFLYIYIYVYTVQVIYSYAHNALGAIIKYSERLV